MSKRRSWTLTVAIWCLIVASVALGGRFPWIGKVWIGVIVAMILAGSVYSLLGTKRNDDGVIIPGERYPRWFERFAADEDGEEKNAGRSGDVSNVVTLKPRG